MSKDTTAQGPEGTKLFVGGLSWETKESDLEEYFKTFGDVTSVNLKLDPVSGKSRCFAFIQLSGTECLDRILSLGDHVINSKKVDVKKARAKSGKIFVGGLKPDMTDEAIRAAFQTFGDILELERPFDKNKNEKKGFGFITFEKEESMKEALKQSKVTIGEHEVDLRKANPRPDPRFGFAAPNYYGGYGDYYGYADYHNYYGAWGGDHFGGGKMGRAGAKRETPY